MDMDKNEVEEENMDKDEEEDKTDVEEEDLTELQKIMDDFIQDDRQYVL